MIAYIRGSLFQQPFTSQKHFCMGHVGIAIHPRNPAARTPDSRRVGLQTQVLALTRRAGPEFELVSTLFDFEQTTVCET